MSVTVRPYRRGGWEVDIRIELSDGFEHRKRLKAPVSAKTAAQRWGEDRERVWYQQLQAERARGPIKEVPTFKEFWPRFVEGHEHANRHKPSGIDGKERIARVHLLPRFGDV